MECEGGGRDGECRRVRGEALVGSDGGRESYGGEREWRRGLERGSSPGLIVAHVPLSLPMSPHRFPCPRVVACVCMSLPVSVCRCPCPCVVAHVCGSLPGVRMCCPWSARRSTHLFTFVGSHFRLWAWVVAFVCGRSSSFRGVHLRSWAVCLHSWATAGCGGGEPLVGGGESSGLA